MTVNSKQLTVNSYKGFTLVELLVVISLIGILATLFLANLNVARERGRDAQRKSDLKNIETALRIYYNDKGNYPCSNSTFQILGCGIQSTCSSVTLCSWGGSFVSGSQTYMSVLSKDPLSPSRDYRYAQTDGDSFTLKACLENASDDKCNSTTESWCNTTLGGCLYIVQQ